MKRVPLPFAPEVSRGSEHQARGAARNRCCWLNLGAAALILFAGSAFGLDKSTGPEGARVKLAKSAKMFNLDGTDVLIGQHEPGEPLPTHKMLDGRITRRETGRIDSHATGVASIMIGAAWNPDGDTPPLEGIAHNAKVLAAGRSYFDQLAWLGDQGVHILNISGGSDDIEADGLSADTLFADYLVQKHGLLLVKAAGNKGPYDETISVPGDSYNGITVGALGANKRGEKSEEYWRVPNYSSRGTVSSFTRQKPDIVAPGSLITMASASANVGIQTDSGTSFATPHVSGTLALLRQHAARQPEPPGDTDWRLDRRVLKATLMNAASKHVAAPKEGHLGWHSTPAATREHIPIDNAMGAGALNGMATLRQYHPRGEALGVRLDTVTEDSKDEWTMSGLTRGSLVTATLIWERDVELTEPDHPQRPKSYRYSTRNLNLHLVRSDGTTVVRKSNSSFNNVEHIYFNVPVDDSYKLLVVNESSSDVKYGLAFSSGSAKGAAFSVHDEGSQRAEGLMAPYNGAAYPNDVNALGVAGPANFRTGGEVFVGSDGVNQQRLSGALGTRSRVGPHNAPPAAMTVLDPESGRGVFGLRNLDEISGLSWGRDGSRRADGGEERDSVLFFSVDPAAVGLDGTAVKHQSSDSGVGGLVRTPAPMNPGGGGPGDEAASDIFASRRMGAFGLYASDAVRQAEKLNDLHLDESAFGLQAPAGRGSLLEDGKEDDLDAFEFDDPVLHERGVDPDGDGMHNRPVFFTLSKDSPTITGNDEFQAADIFVSLPRDPSDEFDLEPSGDGFNIQVYADHTKLGLQAGDVIDALIVSDFGPDNVPDGLFDLSSEVLFSLAPGSPSGGPGDVLYSKLDSSFSVFASAADLGLREADNLNALDIKRLIPAPPTLAVFVSASLLIRPRQRA